MQPIPLIGITEAIIKDEWFIVGYGNAECYFYILPKRHNEIFDTTSHMQNDQWSKLVRPDTMISVVILDRQPTRMLAERSLTRIVHQWQPHCNLRGRLLSHSKLVICTSGIALGREFISAHAACKALGIAPSNMSNHLAGRNGYKTLKGCTFAYSKDQSGANHMSVLAPREPEAPPIPEGIDLSRFSED